MGTIAIRRADRCDAEQHFLAESTIAKSLRPSARNTPNLIQFLPAARQNLAKLAQASSDTLSTEAFANLAVSGRDAALVGIMKTSVHVPGLHSRLDIMAPPEGASTNDNIFSSYSDRL